MFPEYVSMFQAAYPTEVQQAEDITYVHAANAIAAFEAKAWRFDNSPFDRFLRGYNQALGAEAKRGMSLFYGRARCSECHSGVFQTDQDFHSIAMPQIGPGKGDNQSGFNDGHDDFGRERVTGDSADRFKFRTPTLRNIALTAPYGHGGAFDTLEAILRHHFDAVDSLESYDFSQAVLPSRPDLDALDYVVMSDPARRAAIGDANELANRRLKSWQSRALMSFLHSLTDPAALDLRADVPASVPSGLPIAD
jgi:cytochrome c peroxidase